jgi:hypothetical protein
MLVGLMDCENWREGGVEKVKKKKKNGEKKRWA